MELISFIGVPAFDYFASLMLWLLVILIPFFAIVGIFQIVNKQN